MLDKARSFYNNLDQEGKDVVQMSCFLAVAVAIMVIWL